MRLFLKSALILATVVAVLVPGAAEAQIGQLLSPGPLSTAHAKLEGLDNCEKCHDPGKGVSTAKCLACHQPIEQRIRQQRGVHREAGDDCTVCHAEHAGRDADIRPLDRSEFDHLTETGFALDGRHAAFAGDCSKCHKTRSFLTLQPDCTSCHKDSHNGTLGSACATCHATSLAFAESGRAFNHSSASFTLDGAHQTVDCVKCHVNRTYKGLSYGECSACHTDPHDGKLGARCASCHTPSAWQSGTIDHAATGFALVGAHATLQCRQCHTQPAAKVTLAHEACSDCHRDPHLGLFTEDCSSCHNQQSFTAGKFDHGSRTKFPLLDRHAEIACVACHKPSGSPNNEPGGVRTVDFRGLSADCASCHKDPHNGALGITCASCHGTVGFRIGSFQHPNQPEFFVGSHSGLECEKCHKSTTGDAPAPGEAVSSRTYRNLSTRCETCHQDVHLGQLGAECANCHSIATEHFKQAFFDHNKAEFALDGKHVTIECVACHKPETADFPSGSGTAVRYSGMSGDCIGCHKDVHLGQLSSRCSDCHTTTSFKVGAFQHQGDVDFFAGGHSAIECRQCHRLEEGDYPAGHGEALRFSGLDRQCSACHADSHQGTLGSDCASCHSVHAPFAEPSRAFHKATMLPLEGRHLQVPCASCHVNEQIKGTPTRCADCHWFRRQDDRFRTALGIDCETCHSPISWTTVNWDHSAATGHALVGPHASLDCLACHTDGRFDGPVSTDCASCHMDDYLEADDPDHVEAGFPTTCESCHSPGDSSWNQARFEHGSYPLLGSHAAQPCDACHSSGIYQGLPSDCVDCHLDDYNQTNDPDHADAGFSTDCTQCHAASDPDWGDGDFGHDTYPLVGAHASQPCQACHDGGVFQGLPSDCVDCHLDDFNQTNDPDHADAGFSTDCTQCHAASDPDWGDGDFGHDTYPLVGAHASQPCQACHDGGVFQGLPSDCVDCHLDDYNQTNDPDHADAGFSTDCTQCHAASDPDWGDGDFGHDTYPLVGAHASQPCQACHDGGIFQGLPSDCVDCHLDDYNQTNDPDHADAGFSTDCTQCHAASDPDWGDGDFGHDTYPLVGAHASQPCQACHDGGIFQGLPSDCVDCHLDDYNQTNDPDHADAGFSTDCTQCHAASDPDWGDGDFGHDTYPLVGAHASQPCQACHDSGIFQGLPSDCVDCHLDDYNQTNDPDHADAGFSTDCTQCHAASDPDWGDGDFGHDTYPLVGAHASQPCQACHDSGIFQGLPSDCVDCHLDDYNQTNDPDHADAGFSTDCTQCHAASDPDWGDGDFGHDTYPLVGAHASQPCQACHDSGIFQGLPSDCVDCHLDDYNQTNDPDHADAGFSTDCTQCHAASDPDWGDGDFGHDTYPLVGAHASQPCQACHDGGIFQGLPSDCVDCHLDDYNQTDDPDHGAAGFPTDCEICHRASDLDWGQGQFDHVWFPIQGGRHSGFECSECHPNSGNYAVFSCTTACHPRGETDGEHDEVSGYVYDSPACLSCHPDGTSGDFRSPSRSSTGRRR